MYTTLGLMGSGYKRDGHAVLAYSLPDFHQLIHALLRVTNIWNMKVEMTLLSNHNSLINLQGRKGSEHSLDYLIQERTGSVFLRA